MSKKTVGFIGLGAMGRGVAANLIKAGYPVVGYDINAKALKLLTGEGGKTASSPKDLAAKAEVILICVINDEQTENVLFGENGLAEADSRNMIVTLSTLSAPYARNLQNRLEDRGFTYLDCPMSGGEVGAVNATLTLMVGGAIDAFERVHPVLKAIGSHIFHVGNNPGDGATVKTINQLLCGVHLVATAEAVALARRAGIDPALVHEVVKTSAAFSWMFGDRLPRMLLNAPPCSSAIDIFVKDMSLVLGLARSTGISTDLAQAAYNKFRQASDNGYGKEDDSMVVKAYS